MSEKLKVIPYDTTLRDGGQTPGINLTVGSKLRISKALDNFGFPYIEGGWPGANPTDVEFFKEVKGVRLNGELVAFGMTARVNMQAANDQSLQRLLEAGTGVITVFGKSWMLHVKDILRTTPAKNLASIRGTVELLKKEGRRVFYDAEHFFDGYFADSQYAIDTLKAAKVAGAEVVILCDTNGGRTPEEVYEATSVVKKELGDSFQLGIHVHNDGGLAVASTIAAVRAGATQVQGTVNGSGERAGNLDFCEFLPTASFKYGFDINGIDLRGLTEISRIVELENGLVVPVNKAYVGENAFRHKGGVHVSAMRRHPEAYQHINPELVGGKTSYEQSDQGGGANVEYIAEKHGFKVVKGSEKFKRIVAEMKKLKVLGDAQEYLLLHRVLGSGKEPFEIDDNDLATATEFTRNVGSFARVGVFVDDELQTGIGTDPTEGTFYAFAQGLQIALEEKYPEVNDIVLLDYRVSLPRGQRGTRAEVVVNIEFGADGLRWNSKSRAKSQEQAGQDALIDAYKYYILNYRNGDFDNR